MSSDERKRRDAIASTAATLRRASNGKMTQTQAEARVRRAVVSGDLKRANKNR